MAPGVLQNSNPIINNQLDIIETGREIIEVNRCPVDHLDIESNGVKEKKQWKKIRPKVLKNNESKGYLYDRLYDHPCPRVVSRTFYLL